MTVVFCTTCKGRTDHLRRTLPQNIKDNPNAHFVIVNYNDTDGLQSYLKANHSGEIESNRLSVYHYREMVGFHMAHAKNLSHRLGLLDGADVVVNVDADNFCGVGFDSYLTDCFSDPGTFLWSRMVKGGAGRLDRGISGRIAVSKQDFLLTGGYDQKYRTYSPDDKDFNARLRRAGLTAQEIEPRFLNAILHNDKMRFREYPEAAQNVTEDFHVDHNGIVVNEGLVGCGTVFKNFSDEPINVRPIATRIWGIGMHKTATTSLHHALNHLGFKCAHWPSAHWAKKVWQEMNNGGRSETLEKHYAATDLPIPLLFRKLDAAYTGSKFILTTRDEQKWIRSVENHWNPELNRFRSSWDTDPFSHRVHQILYGRTEFHAETMLNRYRRHNAEVVEHFKGRENDLLVMDMDNGAGWKELCEFLGVSTPTIPYPRENSPLNRDPDWCI